MNFPFMIIMQRNIRVWKKKRGGELVS